MASVNPVGTTPPYFPNTKEGNKNGGFRIRLNKWTSHVSNNLERLRKGKVKNDL